MISAHGATITITATTLTVTPSPLFTALGAPRIQLPISDITSIDTHAPTSADLGWARLGEHTIRFAPNQNDQLDALLTHISNAQQGTLSKDTHTITGFDFVAIDVETANADWGSICQIGVARYTNGHITDTNSWLCTPPPGLTHFDAPNIGIHGITPDTIANAPAFSEVIPKVVEFVGELPVVAHNAQFDMTAFSRACAAAHTPAPHWMFGCSLALARAARLGTHNHRLPTVAAHFGVEITQHHEALSDAKACGDIIIGLANRAGHRSGGFADFFWGSGFTLGTLHSDKVQPVLRSDARGLNIAAQKRQLAGEPTEPADTGASKPKRSRPVWEKAATPDVIPETNTEADPTGALFGHNVTLSGDFEPYDKSLLWSGIAERGGTVGKNVTKKTTILVCGPWHTVTSKQKRAEELIKKGQSISLWTAEQLYQELGLAEEPPF